MPGVRNGLGSGSAGVDVDVGVGVGKVENAIEGS